MNSQITALAIQELPGIIALVKSAFTKANPNVELTDADVIAGLNAAIISSLLKDSQWLAVHPER